MVTELTRDEVLAFTEANKEQALALRRVCELVEANGAKLDKLLEKLDNGMKSDIIGAIVGGGEEKTSLNSIKRDTSTMIDDIKMAKYFIGAVVILSVVVGFIVNSVLRPIDVRKIIKEEIAQKEITSNDNHQYTGQNNVIPNSR